MKKNLLSFVIIFLAFFSLASAQTVNKDSLSLVSKMSSDREKLLKLEASVAGKEKDKQDAAIQAQRSADDNRTAAGRLSDDPQDKKLARQADSKAGDAKRDAKRARSAADDLTDLNKDIEKLKEKMARDQKKLDKWIMAAPIVPVKAASDSSGPVPAGR